ncbi:Chromodomain-helicase-DNA-binding protein 6 [Tupaia chinensis]|uniref:Chromodomain-helicase-DNA-binding protein 6 n=1 Tax=Tupaia chinensis TaxID=246437 RepID=L9L3Y2_TUPCH|nr:Chromodomain-helicase-DNA-binding protein 6 [Tupaia chinensis]
MSDASVNFDYKSPSPFDCSTDQDEKIEDVASHRLSQKDLFAAAEETATLFPRKMTSHNGMEDSGGGGTGVKKKRKKKEAGEQEGAAKGSKDREPKPKRKREPKEPKEPRKTKEPKKAKEPKEPKQRDGVKKTRKPREASGTKEAKEKRSCTDSAARTKSKKSSKEQGPTPVEKKKKGKRKSESTVESLELDQGLPNSSLRSPEESTESADSQKRRSGRQVKRRKYNEDLDFKVVDDDGETIAVLGAGRTSALSASTLAWQAEEPPEDDANIIEKILASKTVQEPDEDLFNPDYVEVDRILEVAHTKDAETGEEVTHYLVKWCSLPYEESTWELEEDVDPAKVKEFESLQVLPEIKHVERPASDAWQKLEKSREYKNSNQLREYQLEGMNWLLFNWYNRKNCILADEMGLGKTIQSITFLSEIFLRGIHGPFLIIAPLSTITNWEREFRTWTEMNAIVYHGSQISRQMIQQYEMVYRDAQGNPLSGVFKFHVVITTFEMILADCPELKKIHWSCVIIDEAHRLKNRNCKLLEGLKLMALEHKVLLTGTPLQNSVEELFSLLNFLERERLSVKKLQSILKPMMLRRLKDDVEKNLAPKQETIIEVELTNIQKKYYRAILEKNFSFLTKGANQHNMPNLINTMMELRKCCNHPYLINGAEEKILEDFRKTHSPDAPDFQLQAMIQAAGKLVLIDKLLPKLIAGGHKVLIFSQMVKKLQSILKPMMLRRLKDDVEKNLAPKQETIIEVELTNIQKKYYRAILEKNFSFLTKGANQHNMPNLINTMMELRKCCNHPYLINGAEEKILEDFRKTHSPDAPDFQLQAMIQAAGKLVLIDKLLPKLIAGGHKVLIFSQMVRCLDILEDYLIQRRYTYERIDGRVRGNLRQAAIDRFCKPDSDRFVFLLCTRAGGLGINLTAADTCIIFDSDWNPQNDLQAQARCHRIGQSKAVKVYRLITRNSYEREMFDKASLKLGLDKAVLQDINRKGSTNGVQQLSKMEVEDLLRKGAYGALMDEEDEGSKFCEEDIDQILQRRTHTITIQSEGKGSTFAKASFVASGNRTDISLDDPNFWQKWAKIAELDTEAKNEKESLVIDRPRVRKQTKHYNSFEEDELMEFSELDSDSDERPTRSRRLNDKARRYLRAECFRVEKNLLIFGGYMKLSVSNIQATLVTFVCYSPVVLKGLSRQNPQHPSIYISTISWGRWKDILTHGRFKWHLNEKDMEMICRALLVYCVKHYKGDEKIKSFIWELITPTKDGQSQTLQNHSGLSAPVPRGRKGKKTKNQLLLPELKNADWLATCNPEVVLHDDGYKKHLKQHCNKVLLRVRMLYYLKAEILGEAADKAFEGTPARELDVPLPDIDYVEIPVDWWDAEADKSLLIGVFKHGYERYNAMRADPALCFLEKVGMPDEKSLSAEQGVTDGTSDIPERGNTDKEDNAEDKTDGLQKQTESSGDGGDGIFGEKKDDSRAARLRRLVTVYQRCNRKELCRPEVLGPGNQGYWVQEEMFRRASEMDLINKEAQKRWTRREQADFYRTVSSFGVVYDQEKKIFDWTQFRIISRLDKKSDESLEHYFYSFVAMCRNVCRLPARKDGGPADATIYVEPITEERAARTLYRIELLRKVREQEGEPCCSEMGQRPECIGQLEAKCLASPSLDPGNESGFVDMCNLHVCDSKRNLSSDQQLIDLLESKSLESKLILSQNRSDEEEEEEENEEENLAMAVGMRDRPEVLHLTEHTTNTPREKSLSFHVDEARKGNPEAVGQPLGLQKAFPSATCQCHCRHMERWVRGLENNEFEVEKPKAYSPDLYKNKTNVTMEEEPTAVPSESFQVKHEPLKEPWKESIERKKGFPMYLPKGTELKSEDVDFENKDEYDRDGNCHQGMYRGSCVWDYPGKYSEEESKSSTSGITGDVGDDLQEARAPTIAQLLQEKTLYSFSEWPKDRVIINRLDNICHVVLKGKWPSSQQYEPSGTLSTPVLASSAGSRNSLSEPEASEHSFSNGAALAAQIQKESFLTPIFTKDEQKHRRPYEFEVERDAKARSLEQFSATHGHPPIVLNGWHGESAIDLSCSSEGSPGATPPFPVSTSTPKIGAIGSLQGALGMDLSGILQAGLIHPVTGQIVNGNLRRDDAATRRRRGRRKHVEGGMDLIFLKEQTLQAGILEVHEDPGQATLSTTHSEGPGPATSTPEPAGATSSQAEKAVPSKSLLDWLRQQADYSLDVPSFGANFSDKPKQRRPRCKEPGKLDVSSLSGEERVPAVPKEPGLRGFLPENKFNHSLVEPVLRDAGPRRRGRRPRNELLKAPTIVADSGSGMGPLFMNGLIAGMDLVGLQNMRNMPGIPLTGLVGFPAGFAAMPAGEEVKSTLSMLPMMLPGVAAVPQMFGVGGLLNTPMATTCTPTAPTSLPSTTKSGTAVTEKTEEDKPSSHDVKTDPLAEDKPGPSPFSDQSEPAITTSSPVAFNPFLIPGVSPGLIYPSMFLSPGMGMALPAMQQARHSEMVGLESQKRKKKKTKGDNPNPNPNPEPVPGCEREPGSDQNCTESSAPLPPEREHVAQAGEGTLKDCSSDTN